MNLALTEDEAVEQIIGDHKVTDEAATIYPEEHYNHYGDRGVADLFVDQTDHHPLGSSQFVYEVKSERALKESTGANEILRQFNRMRKFFFKGTDHTPRNDVFYRLLFIPTDQTLRHIIENYSIYTEVVDVGGVERQGNTHRTQICLLSSKTSTVGFHLNIVQGSRDPAHRKGIIEDTDPELAAEFNNLLAEYARL